MKICCERCEQVLKRNHIGNCEDTIELIRPGALYNEKIILCKSCGEAFDKFLKGVEVGGVNE